MPGRTAVQHPWRLRLPGLPRSLVVSLVALLFAALASQDGRAQIPDGAEVKDLYIVDCLLPGQVRKLGTSTYITPRRPISTTAQECRLRGGEYVAYDRADYKTALKVWLPAAEGGAITSALLQSNFSSASLTERVGGSWIPVAR